MSAKVTLPRGTQDVLPAEWRARHRVLDAARRRFEAAGYGRIATPTFEHSELFHRSVGESSDIVSKETYTFTDRGERSLTLRPEGTAGVARAFVTHGMHREPLPVKLWYAEPMFRYEKPQAGRLREHTQLGCEAIGSDSPAVEAELIVLLAGLYRELAVPGVRLHLNSVGSSEARDHFRTALVAFLEPLVERLDPDSRERLRSNPLRILDSKVATTRELLAGAPALPHFLTTQDRDHLAELRGMLDAAGVEHELDPQLVRGLDYYTRTVFEFRCSALGAQDGIGAGGRYDGLVSELGGPSTPAVGFGSGLERIVLALGARGAGDAAPPIEAYVGAGPDTTGAERRAAFLVATGLRERGVGVELDLVGRSDKGQGRQASRLGARLRVASGGEGMVLHLAGTHEPRIIEPDEAVAAVLEVLAGTRQE